jgi:hypothetical protein
MYCITQQGLHQAAFLKLGLLRQGVAAAHQMSTLTSLTSKDSMYRSDRRSSATASATSKPAATHEIRVPGVYGLPTHFKHIQAGERCAIQADWASVAACLG